jgi:hypothetical protein
MGHAGFQHDKLFFPASVTIKKCVELIKFKMIWKKAVQGGQKGSRIQGFEGSSEINPKQRKSVNCR